MRWFLTTSILLVLFLASPAKAARYPIALTGDSITESSWVRTTGWEGFGDQLRRSLLARGVSTGGYGFVPMHKARCCSSETSFVPWRFSGQWKHLGALGSITEENDWAANGLSSQGSNAAAETELWADRIGIQYLRRPGDGKIEVWLDGTLRTLLQASGARPSNQLHWLATSWKRHHLRLKTTGNAVIMGVVASHAPSRKGQVEIDQLGQGGARSYSNFRPLQKAALKQLAPRITLVMFGANEEMSELSTGADVRPRMYAALVERGELARQTGGCVFAHHPPILPAAHLPLSGWSEVQARYRQTGRDAAKAAGCKWIELWDNLWDPLTGYAEGWTIDGLHPSIKGYHAMSEVLAAWLVSHYALPRR